MVRVYLILVLVAQAWVASAQMLSFGMRLGTGVTGSMQTTGEQLDYYFFAEREQARTTGEGMVHVRPYTEDAFIPEVFVRYNSRNRFFLQAGAYRNAYEVFYGLDELIEEQFNPVWEYWSPENTLNRAPKYHLGSYRSCVNTYLSASYFLRRSGVIRPFVSIGVQPTMLANIRGLKEPEGTPEDIAMANDFARQDPIVINGRASLGLQFYDLHVEVYAVSNISAVDSSPRAYTDRITTIWFSLGYNFVSLNLVKKAKP